MFEERLSGFTQYLRFEKRYAEHTLTAYEHDILQFYHFLSIQFDISDIFSVTHFHVRSWLAALKDDKKTARTINRKMSSLSCFYKYLQKNQFTELNPVKQLHAQKLPERLPVFLKERETDFLLEEMQFDEGFKGFTDRLIVELLYVTGMRRNELLQLKETDIEWGQRQIRVLGKGNKERLIPLSSEMLETLKEYIRQKKQLEHHDKIYLFNLETGQPLYAGYIYRIVTKYLGQVTTMKKRSPHVLRHTFATHLLNNGANIQAIKDLLGHSSLAATQIYTHNNIEKLKEIHKLNHPRG